MTEGGRVAWDDPSLGDPADSARRARYRRKQSWYREVVLGVPPGRDADGNLRGNLLDADAVAERPHLAFLSGTGPYVDARVTQRPATPDGEVRHDLLSRAGIAFNLFTSLRSNRRAAVRVLRGAFKVDAAEIESLEIEPEPPAGESGWLDALAVYRTPARRIGFVGVVVRYADPPPRLDVGQAREHHGADRLLPAVVEHLADVGAVELWAAAKEVAMLRDRSGAAFGQLSVLATSDDAATWQTVDILRNDPATGEALRSVSFEEVIGAVIQRDGLSGWADGFRARYLDLHDLPE